MSIRVKAVFRGLEHATAPSIKTEIGKREEILTESIKKMGRPTDNPRPYRLSIRISDADKRILEEYCARTGVNRTEAISRGIGKLESEHQSPGVGIF